MSDIFDACEDGKIERVRQIINHDPQSIHSKSEGGFFGGGAGWTPLHYACSKGRVEVVRLLLSRNVDTNAKDPDGKLPLDVFGFFVTSTEKQQIRALFSSKQQMKNLCSQSQGGAEEVRGLLSSNPDLVHWDFDDNETPLNWACLNGNVEVVSILLENDANMGVLDKEGRKPGQHFDGSVDSSTAQKIKNLLEKKEQQKKEQMRKLCVQSLPKWGGVEEVRRILSSYPDSVNWEYKKSGFGSKDNGTPLHIACKNGNLEVVTLLLDNKANIEAQDKDNATPLHVASFWEGNIEVVKLLLKNKANIEAQAKYNRTPLHEACRGGNVEIVNVLLENKANIEAQDEDNWTPLHWGCWCSSKKVEIVDVLLKNKANIEAQNKDHATPLHVACRLGNVETVKVLLENKANIEAQDKEGRKPGQHFDINVDSSTTQKIKNLLNNEPEQ